MLPAPQTYLADSVQNGLTATTRLIVRKGYANTVGRCGGDTIDRNYVAVPHPSLVLYVGIALPSATQRTSFLRGNNQAPSSPRRATLSTGKAREDFLALKGKTTASKLATYHTSHIKLDQVYICIRQESSRHALICN